MGIGGGPVNWRRKREGYCIVTEAASTEGECVSRAALFEQDVEVWSGPPRSGSRKRLEVLRDLEEKKAERRKGKP